MYRKKIALEHIEQKAFIKWCNNQWFAKLVISIENSRNCTKKQGHEFNLLGRKKGVQDLLFALPMGEFSGLFIEMKRKDGGIISKEQLYYKEFLTEVGYKCVVCNGSEQAKIAILEYLACYNARSKK